MKRSRLMLSFTIASVIVLSARAQEGGRVSDVLKRIVTLEIPASGYPVERTVVEAMKKTFGQTASVVEVPAGQALRKGSFRIQVLRSGAEASAGWFRLQMSQDGTGELTASHTHLLYTAFCRVRDEWADNKVEEFAQGRTASTRLPWLEGNDGMFASLPRFIRNYDPEATIQELARLGCSHVSVNVLASPTAYEEGPPGEIYPRFYASSPDLDQFVVSDLTRGLYPPEYLQANLDLLKKNVALALAYGLTPGLTICSPWTMPEAFFTKYPYLRGARVDHPYRSYRPRYTATLSHPVVRWHYAQLMVAMMKEVPELGYLYLWTNDSGSGFEYVSTLYAGRNGGAYLIREWKSDESIARAAGENVLRYLRLLRDAASETNPRFRVITSASWFGAEQDIILGGLGDRLDLYVQPADTANARRWPVLRALETKGSQLFGAARAATNYILGAPCPWLSRDRLEAAMSPGIRHVAVTFDPPSLAPWSINREIIRAFQSDTKRTVDEIVGSTARRWAGITEGEMLVRAWRLTDQAVRSFPDIPLYGTSWAFPLYRHWVRPFVPNILAIPENERRYYEQHMIATFNNPTMIDFGADALWLLIDTAQANSIVRTCDSLVWKPLDEALAVLDVSLKRQAQSSSIRDVLQDQRNRLQGLRCYFRTLRNIAGWIANVRGYMAASSRGAQIAMLSSVRATIDDELKNAEDLLRLWNTSHTNFMPVASLGENWAFYGSNLGELLQKKIDLMKKHREDIPFIDPNFMWRMGAECPVPPAEYLKY
ncbi:MAG: hypothetical protein NTZ35_17330 [Ignavibacteriales bacterium]|nr:hypothetical protein [Ignavibacteriales bacterium]